MKWLPLRKLFNNNQIIYLQGILADVDLKYLYEQTQNNLNRERQALEKFMEFPQKDHIPMPLVMIMWSPYHQIQCFSGVDALKFLRPFYQIGGVVEPPEPDLEKVMERLVGIANFQDPKIPQFKVGTGTPINYPFWEGGLRGNPTEIFCECFRLKKAKRMFNFPIFSYTAQSEQVV
jgi:hypothetical protein